MIKCVIWDLDETIFDGTISEDKELRVRAGVVQILELLHRCGIVPSIASRNEPIPALRWLAEAGIRDYFVYPQISWGAKSQSVGRILADLHFRPDDVLFVDDQEFERDGVKASFPTIHTVNGRNLAEVVELVEESRRSTGLDGCSRIDMYRHEERRLADRETFRGNGAEFLTSCSIEVSIRKALCQDFARLSELMGRTNQVNSGKVLLDEKRFRELRAQIPPCLFVSTVSDRYGTYGQSGLLICEPEAGDTLVIRSLVVSCRLLGKGIAQVLLAVAGALASLTGRAELILRYVPTEFNRQMQLLFVMNGFSRVAEREGVITFRRYLRQGPIALPPWLRVECPGLLDLESELAACRNAESSPAHVAI